MPKLYLEEAISLKISSTPSGLSKLINLLPLIALILDFIFLNAFSKGETSGQ